MVSFYFHPCKVQWRSRWTLIQVGLWLCAGLCWSSSLAWGQSIHVSARSTPSGRVGLGHEQIREIYTALGSGRAPVAVVANHTSVLFADIGHRQPVHLVDTLMGLGVDVRKVFAPEHGFRGDAANGAFIEDGLDEKTGLPVISLHGKHKKPTLEMLSDVRAIVFDIQDVGARFYTYLSTLALLMEAAAENDKLVVVLDRPNPHAHHMAGPLLEAEMQSFVGHLPVPLVHGMTLGEMAQMINGEGWLPGGITCDLEVIPCKNYAHSDIWFPPIAPSPNLPTAASIALYPSLCLFEATAVSVGRGTPTPFEIIGYPGHAHGSFAFVPEPITGAAPHPKYEGQQCTGSSLQIAGENAMHDPDGFSWSWLQSTFEQWCLEGRAATHFFTQPDFFDKLAGTRSIRNALEEDKDWSALESEWLSALQNFDTQRQPYLLYPMQRNSP